MADALIPVGKIYEGFWIDWTRDRVMGCTLTLCPKSATVLTNSLAMWVTLCSIQLWTIIRYTLHQRGSSLQIEARTPQLSGQQVILRNAGSALTTARLMLVWAWNTRSSTGQRSIRAYVIAISAAAYAVLFTIAGAVSNHAITAPQIGQDSAVLLRSPQCGVWNQTVYDIVENGEWNDISGLDMFVQYAAKKAYEIQLSLEYAQECYLSAQNTTDSSSTCQTLKQPSLSLNRYNSTLCPFAPQMCHGDSHTIVLDTGDIDSHVHLGINSAPQNRLKYRRITRCAVLDSTSYVDGWNGTMASLAGPRPVPEAAHANYGPNLVYKTNWTYSYSNFASFYDGFSADVTTPYQVGVKTALAPADPAWLYSEFDPIQELFQETADVTLAFLSFTGMYLGQVNDPWFRADNKQNVNASKSFLRERYTRDTAISTLGCTEQHRFCTSDNICTDWLGFSQVQNNQTFNASLTPHQNATFDRILRAVDYSRLQYVVKVLAATTTPLLASQSAADGNSGATLSEVLPDDQWVRELEYWHSIAMAQMQRTVARWATGQVVPEPGYLLHATDPQDVWFCENLIVPSAIYTSFSVVAIVIILVLGCLIIIVGFFIERVAALFRRCLRKSTPRRPWDRDDMIELQRRKTVARHRQSATTNQDIAQSSAPRPFDSSWIVSSQPKVSVPNTYEVGPQVIPQWQYIRLHHGIPRSVPRANHQATSQPPARPIRESWMTISLCSVDSNSRRAPLNKELVPGKVLRQEPVSYRTHAVMTQHADSTVNSSLAPPHYPEWV